jgi:hypothetical protein
MEYHSKPANAQFIEEVKLLLELLQNSNKLRLKINRSYYLQNKIV